MLSNTKLAEDFLKKSFQENPSYSFGDWTIMFEHSLIVCDLALKIAGSVDCDKELLEVESLFHDVGKAHKADPEFLREHHAELGYEVVKDFLPNLELAPEQSQKLTAFLKGNLDSIEAKIIKDADIIAFFSDLKLQTAFNNWADRERFTGEMQRKADKIEKLKFDMSKEIARPLHKKMIDFWHLN